LDERIDPCPDVVVGKAQSPAAPPERAVSQSKQLVLNEEWHDVTEFHFLLLAIGKAITAPLTPQSVGLLAGIVAIRTSLSFSLETEIEGCWPWQRAQRDSAGQTCAKNSENPG
jgi:hypothetical protein